MKLYDRDVSGNSYKVRLFLALLGLPYETVTINTAKGEQKQPEFLQLNPRGQIPVLEADGKAIWDSTAILVYLARRYGGEKWLPLEAHDMAEVVQWLALAQNEILYGLAYSRVIILFKRPVGNLSDCQARGQGALKVLERHLRQNEWLALGRLTIADLACYPYVALAEEGGIPLDPYTSVLAWMKRIQMLPGYVTMPGLRLV
ncbi:MAG TPA: glutathione S-transferase family protein [Burkholderiales bacterium]|nr:glutathione S-transferase family protein [Burkholderiales bacterium]